MASVEVSLKDIMTSVEGALGAAVVDYSSGMALGTMGGGKDLDLTVAAAGQHRC
ncbi:Secreted protein OS=Streptomyces albaduncus OX=68172 GN=FHS32_002751 PE=4 SV=1 [Streptomyces griseoloalbus]